jgi:hypothetical protein
MSTVKDKAMTKFYLGFFLAAAVLAGVVSFYASSSPDGLEKVAEDEGFLETAKDSAVANSPLADYGVSGLDSERLSVGLSGIIGIVVTAIVATMIFNLAKKKSQK